mmetsp:Transcript_8510/g.14026  ORF Transcript_8510/g.14026 Transcript_8510/m.14026 type:complete len:731 (+) Transcript_8510:81-2273(+)|eukprot:scaffold7348_cov144-Skeletonema_menzelii.AAC.3
MCRRPTILRRLSSRATQGIAAFFSPVKKEELVCSSNHKTLKLKKKSDSYHEGHHYTIFVNPVILVGVFLSFVSIAFCAGCFARISMISNSVSQRTSSSRQHLNLSVTKDLSVKQLPPPTVIPGKEVPPTTYTFEHFPVEGSRTSHDLHLDRSLDDEHERGSMQHARTSTEDSSGDSSDDDDDSNDEDEEKSDPTEGLHLPAGQHLLVDIKNVDPVFLNSEVRLAEAMIKLVDESKLTLLSYHCHGLVPVGVSCAGVLLESHVAFHTWPTEGVISMDLFTCGSGKLIPTLPSIQQLFGVKAANDDADDPIMLWSHKLRGFRKGFVPGYNFDLNPLDSDLGADILGSHDFDIKKPLVSAETDYQTVDVYEVLDSATSRLSDYYKSLEDDGSYESLHPEFFAPDKVLLLDGRVQSTRYGDAPYHESIVHPAMITHPNPKRVAVIGGGEGATVREILKHSTLEKVVMIEIDEGVVNLSTKHLPEWQDCSSIAHHDGCAEWCFDDERAELRVEDALAYFNDNFGSSSRFKSSTEHEARFDVVIMDCLDPNDDHPFATVLYTDDGYINSLYGALTDDGVLVVQVGEAAEIGNAADENDSFKNRSTMMKMLDAIGFKSIHIYEESHCEFGAPWTTLIAFKSVEARKRWYRSPAAVELDLSRRILPTKDGKTSLRYFDGATMKSYQMPSRAFEDIYCLQQDKPEECSDKVRFGLGKEINVSSAYSPVFERHFADVTLS